MSEGQGDLWGESQVSGLSSQMGGGDYVFFVSLSPFIEKKECFLHRGHWEYRVLAIRPPRKSQIPLF